MSRQLSCIIVDDEPLSREVLEKYVSGTPQLLLSGSCSDAFEAMELIRDGRIDLVFLDINMPRLSGIGMVKAMEKSPLIIFTTAYPEYAIEGFELDVVDYLVKPFGYERFLKAVNKAFDRLSAKSDLKDAKNSYIVVKSDKKIYKIEYDALYYIQSAGDYLKLVTQEQVIIIHDTMKNMEHTLPEDPFIRIHKSFLINLKHVKYVEGNEVNIGKEKLPVGASYKEHLMKRLADSGSLH
ncbi:MAG: LytTR family DNA-binding domain-containing protein [Bacteroidetes bacterium]|nr:LytTR family DNA-binding domain-containing protein [Bacteroidota bacterium]